MARVYERSRYRRVRPVVPDAPPVPVCPRCGHAHSVQRVPELAPRRRPRINPLEGIDSHLIGRAALLAHHRRQRYAPPRGLDPPALPASPWQSLDRRLTLAIDLAFGGLAVFLFGVATRAEFQGVAAALGGFGLLIALWLAIALATGRFARANAAEQAAYARAMRRWRALFYCEDCGSAFRRDRHGHLGPDAVPGYLRRAGDDDTIAT